MRRLDGMDLLLGKVGAWLATAGARLDPSDYPAGEDISEDTDLNEEERRMSAACMRVNHAGEVAAQGLYLGQSLVARKEEIRVHLRAAAREEAIHLHWCSRRVGELQSRISLLTPLWYAGSVSIGVVAGAMGDRRSLGFVVETERQVEAHLESHLERLPERDARSRRIVERMRGDEARHRQDAEEAGADPVPAPVSRLMMHVARFMTGTARWI